MTTGRLNIIRLIAAAYANELRNSPTRAERKARYVLTALVAAIHNGTLDSLVDAIKPWMRNELGQINSLSDAHEFDRLSEAVGEMSIDDRDLDDYDELKLTGIELPSAYSGIGD